MAILPERPLTVRFTYILRSVLIVILVALSGAAILVAAALWQGHAATRILAEKRIWASGKSAPSVEVSGKVVSRKIIFKSYNLKVDWRDEANNPHHSLVDFDTIYSEVNKNQDLELHYDPAVPGDVALSWARDVEGGRWASAICYFAVFAVVGGALLFGAWNRLRTLLDIRKCAQSSHEVALAVTTVEDVLHNGKATGHRRYWYHLDGSGLGVKDQDLSVTFRFGKGELPLFTDSARTHLVGLVSPEAPERPVVLRADFHPYKLSEQVQQDIRARIAAAKR